MISKNLTGWLLIIGTVGSLLFFMVLDPVLIGWGDGPSGRLGALMNNQILSSVVVIFGTVIFSAQVAGFALMANSMKGDNKAGAGVASLASICFTVVITVIALSNGYQLGMMDLGSNDQAAATNLLQSGRGLWKPLDYFLPIGVILLGIGILNQKNFHATIGWIFVVLGAIIFVTNLLGLNDDNDALGLAQWISTSIFTIIVGIVVLRSK